MAWSDYKICDCCGNAKVFYDANIQDARYQATWGKPSDYDPIGLQAICGECNKTHEVVVALREKGAADPAAIREAALREAALRIGGMIRGHDKTEYEEGYNDALATAERHILALIGEKK